MPKRSKPNRPAKPGKSGNRSPGSTISPELRAAISGLRKVAAESPDGWATIAQAVKEQEEFDPGDLMTCLAQAIGKEVLPLLRGAALDADEEFAIGALRALPLLGSRAAAEALAEACALHSDGERARLAWEGVQALQARGIQVSVSEPGGLTKPPARLRIREIWETLPDGVGTREIIVRAQDHYGTWQALFVCWNDRAGVKDSFLRPCSRREWEELRAEHVAGLTLVPVTPEYAQWQLARARTINSESGFPLGEILKDWDEYVGSPPPDYSPPDACQSARMLPLEEREALLDHLDCLLRSPMFDSWGLEPADCREWLAEFRRLNEDDEEAQDEAMHALCGRVVAACVTPAIRSRYAARMAEVARKLEWMRRSHESVVAAAVAIELEGDSPPEESVFLRAMAENGLAMLEEMILAGVDPETERYDPLKPVDDHTA